MRDFLKDPEQILLRKRMETFGSAGYLMQCRFEVDSGQVPQLRYAENYTRHWHDMRQKGLGLLLWGPPGSGKSFAAACIANAFIASREPFPPRVIMTDFGTILRQNLAAPPQQRQEDTARLLDTDLLILDDFGAERWTDFTQEQIYHVVNGRYVRRAPLIVTTNMTLQQLRAPETTALKRICDRLLEMCVPVCFDGDSLRSAKAAENLQYFRQLCQGETLAKSDGNCYDRKNGKEDAM